MLKITTQTNPAGAIFEVEGKLAGPGLKNWKTAAERPVTLTERLESCYARYHLRYRIQAIPTLILFQAGEERDRIIGAASKDAIARAIEARIGAALN